VVGSHEIDIIVETNAGYLPIIVYYSLEEDRTIKRENRSVEFAKAFGEPIVVSRYGENLEGVKTYSLRDFLLLPISSIV
jgi:predicted AAA+ superfamily ATPase